MRFAVIRCFNVAIAMTSVVYLRVGVDAAVRKRKAVISNLRIVEQVGNRKESLTKQDDQNFWQRSIQYTMVSLPTPTPKPTPARLPPPSPAPYPSPTTHPTPPVTNHPSTKPTFSPTPPPTPPPTTFPTIGPTPAKPSEGPSTAPFTSPPTTFPTIRPSSSQTLLPTFHPSASPTSSPSLLQTQPPTAHPTASSTVKPSALITQFPTLTPTTLQTKAPSRTPVKPPTPSPSEHPTHLLTRKPSSPPSQKPATPSPTKSPTSPPTSLPTPSPTPLPSSPPSSKPSFLPTALPTPAPTAKTTPVPTAAPTATPFSVNSPAPISSPSPVAQSCNIVADIACQAIAGQTGNCTSLAAPSETQCLGDVPPFQLQFIYTGGSCSSSNTHDPAFSCTDLNGGTSGASEAFITIVNQNNVVLYQNVTQLGQLFTASGAFGNSVNVTIQSVSSTGNAGAVLQISSFRTQCQDDNDLTLLNLYGALQLAGFSNGSQGTQSNFAVVQITYSIDNNGTTPIQVTSATITSAFTGTQQIISSPTTLEPDSPVTRSEMARLNLADDLTVMFSFELGVSAAQPACFASASFSFTVG